MTKNIEILTRLVEQISQQIGQKAAAHMQEYAQDLTLAQIRLLKSVFLAEEISMTDLASRLAVTPASATSMVDRLVQQGWLVRTEDEHDRRRVNVKLSPEKQAEWGKHHLLQMQVLADYFSVLTDQEQADFIKLVTKLVQKKN